ncbi:DMT family transporter [Alkaliphilus crotonatoxidans]
MYKSLGFINGMILAVMVFLNGMLTSITGPYLSTLIFHISGLILIIMISVLKKNKLSNFKDIPLMFFLPGILGVITILLNNIVIPQIGITLVTGISLFSQLVMSSLVECFGLFGTPQAGFKKEKMLGFTIISLGVMLMIIL